MKPQAIETPIGDGFTAEELQDALKPKPAEFWHPDFEYADMRISDLIAGPKAVTFMGRVANIFDVANSPRTPRSAKGCIKLCVKDGSGAITVRLWWAERLPNIRLGSLAVVWATHISNGESGKFSSSSAPLFASLFPERDRNCHIMVHENSDDGNLCRTPLDYQHGLPIDRLMTIKAFQDGGYDVVDAKILVVIKSIGAKKKVTRKDESVTENISLLVHDDTGEATLGLWGTCASSPAASTLPNLITPDSKTATQAWKPGETVLLLQAPGWKLGRTMYLSLTSATIIDVDPAIPDTAWLRRWALRHQIRAAINPSFPENVFDSDLVRKGPTRCLFTLADLDEFVRCSLEETFQGYLRLLITEFKLLAYWRRHMLLSGECCSIPIHANALTATCTDCDAKVKLRINPRIIGQVMDETAAIGCGKLLFSDDAWHGLLGCAPQDLLSLDGEEVKFLSDRILFTRVSVLFGWTPDETKAGGRICVLEIEAQQGTGGSTA